MQTTTACLFTQSHVCEEAHDQRDPWQLSSKMLCCMRNNIVRVEFLQVNLVPSLIRGTGSIKMLKRYTACITREHQQHLKRFLVELLVCSLLSALQCGVLRQYSLLCAHNDMHIGQHSGQDTLSNQLVATTLGLHKQF